LVPVAGAVLIEDVFGPGPGVFVQGEAGALVVGETGVNALDVAIDEGGWVVLSDAGDGAGGVSADSGHSLPFLNRGGEVFADQRSGSLMKHAASTVVAEALPFLEDLLLVRLGEGVDIGEALHPVLPERDDGGDLGLLKHDLAHPDGVGVFGAPPGKVALAMVEPVEQRDFGLFGQG
jgi:hypothetical protein